MRGILDVLQHIDNTFEKNVRKVEIVSFWDKDSYDHSLFDLSRDTIKKYEAEWGAKVTYVKPEDWNSEEYAEFYLEVENAVYRKIDAENHVN
ncbi:Oidioi.mRNA.OKI2018_I69.PAR.g12957.t1.cds [Oikopleura dioica]|uniref:Oidioi.mRNA.OKI2018_I69.PAR.g12957.t1.cds n=1 Tax=Oikopleura dioica TaxID=34765 RepID=A0ABN7S2M0_OIKDI|nr:Oidioi.mRNA.OKI2018_I69.PAR.g12957.t1.cds [Oikopleura dioica]